MNVELFNFNLFLSDLSVYLFIIFLSRFNTFYKNRDQLIVLIYTNNDLVFYEPILPFNQS
jgi:hypothetical protein